MIVMRGLQKITENIATPSLRFRNSGDAVDLDVERTRPSWNIHENSSWGVCRKVSGIDVESGSTRMISRFMSPFYQNLESSPIILGYFKATQSIAECRNTVAQFWE